MIFDFSRSERLLDEARMVVPLGAQTFSKSFTQFPRSVSPYFAERGEGAVLWDVDGNRYVDFINGLASVTLGYCDPDVDAAVRDQLTRGTIFSLSAELEADVARLICELVPSAEMVRFGKNGSDATAGAIRVARAATGRNHVLTCGYHGWQDWYIGATARNKGVPQAVRDLTDLFPYNDAPALAALLERHSGQVAAVIMEPMNVTAPAPGYLAEVKRLAHEAGAVLIFDETITGFRHARGGAQEYFGVTPDLTTLGKGIANGYPLSAVCGRRDLMMEMEEVFFSFTMGGELLSLAAAKAALTKLRDQPVIETMIARGEEILAGARMLIDKHGCGDFLSASGHPAWSFLLMKDSEGANSFEMKTLFMQEMIARGVLTFGSHNMSFSHRPEHVEHLLAAYDEVFPLLRRAAHEGALKQLLRCEPLVPLFRVR